MELKSLENPKWKPDSEAFAQDTLISFGIAGIGMTLLPMVSEIWHRAFSQSYEHSLRAILWGIWLGLVFLWIRTISLREKARRYGQLAWLVQVPGDALQARQKLDLVLSADSSVTGCWRSAEAEGPGAKRYVRKIYQGGGYYRIKLRAQFLPTDSTSSTLVRYWFETDQIPLWAPDFVQLFETTEQAIASMSRQVSRIDLSNEK